jgi:RNA polymerase sigma-32 factor
MHAVRDFNPNKGVKLITYAVWWIRGYIQDYLMKQYSLVRIGTTQNQKKLFYQLQKQKEALESLADSPQLAIISQRTGIDPSEIKEMAQRLSGRDVSLDKSTNDDGGDTFLSRQKDLNLPPDESLALKENLNLLSEIVEKLTPKLSPKEKIILDERILNDEPLTLQEIGDKYKITREAVRQSENRLMTKIKNEFLAAHKTEPG